MRHTITDDDLLRAPSLAGGPISVNAQRLVLAARGVDQSPTGSSLRAWSVPYLFRRMEDALLKQLEPVAVMNDALARLSDVFDVAGKSGLSTWPCPHGASAGVSSTTQASVELITGEHYGNLFREFSPQSYWKEPTRILRQRLERNNVSLRGLEGMSVLDAGCGGGRYTVAWRQLGAGQVVGYDVSKTGLADARQRVKVAGIQGVTFEEGNVLNLPYPDGSFDVVFSNGVLHHTADWRQGVRELVRVLKPGGLGWLYLIESPGGLFWDAIEILRVLTHHEDREYMRRSLELLGHPANRIFYMLDHVMVPINERLTADQIADGLESAGASDIRRLDRGCDFDRVEYIHQKLAHAVTHFGVGEHRFVFSKPTAARQS